MYIFIFIIKSCFRPTYVIQIKGVFLHIFTEIINMIRELGSSVSILSGYGLDDRAIEVRSPAEAKEFFL
jgi:hypothetical protein